MLPPHTLHVDDYGELRDLVKSWIAGNHEMMVILGGPGIGKSETVERLMSESFGPVGQKWAYIKGRITPLKLYEKLYDYRLLPIVINDVDPLLKDETNVSLLKCVCDSSKVKTVQWDSFHAAFGKLPKRFDSISKVLLIANSWEKVNQNISALHNRAVVIHFRPGAMEVHREIGESDWFDDQEVWEFIGKNLFLMTTPDFRFYIHARQYKLSGLDWKDLTLRMLESEDQESGQSKVEKEKLVLVARLLADPKYDAKPAPESEREKVFQMWFGKDGGSRATYHRYKQKLKERRGDFDLEKVRLMQWRPRSSDPTPHEIKLNERRAALEQEQQELFRAGGVQQDDDDGNAA